MNHSEHAMQLVTRKARGLTVGHYCRAFDVETRDNGRRLDEVSVTVNTRLRTSFGRSCWRPDGGYHIELNPILWNHEGMLRKTFIHELAHVMVGNDERHNYIWQAKDIDLGGDGVPKVSLEQCKLVGFEMPKRRRSLWGGCQKCERVFQGKRAIETHQRRCDGAMRTGLF